MPTVLITGASQTTTIGYQVARRLGEQGYTIVLTARSVESGEKVKDALVKDFGVKDVHVVKLDLTDPASIKAVVPQVEKAIGDTLDVLINCAGTSFTGSNRDQAIDVLTKKGNYRTTKGLRAVDVDYDEMEEIFRTNLFGAIALTNALSPLFLRSKAPRLVFVTSTVGNFDYQSKPESTMDSFFTYAQSKAAMNMAAIGYSKQLPLLNPKIKVNLGCPGYVSSGFNGYQGFRSTEDGAAVIVHLATLGEDGPNGEWLADYPPYGEPGKPGKVPW